MASGCWFLWCRVGVKIALNPCVDTDCCRTYLVVDMDMPHPNLRIMYDMTRNTYQVYEHVPDGKYFVCQKQPTTGIYLSVPRSMAGKKSGRIVLDQLRLGLFLQYYCSADVLGVRIYA